MQNVTEFFQLFFYSNTLKIYLDKKIIDNKADFPSFKVQWIESNVISIHPKIIQKLWGIESINKGLKNIKNFEDLSKEWWQ